MFPNYLTLWCRLTFDIITQLRGEWQRVPALAGGLEGIAVMPTFHPAFVLRRYTPEIRGKAWSDLQQVMTKLGLSLPK